MHKINHTILIDDNKTTNFLNRYLMLKSKRFKKIEAFVSGISVLERFAVDPTFQPDVIFLDIDMPDISGWEFLDAFEELYANRINTKTFILSSAINKEYLQGFSPKNLVSEYLIKPLNLKIIEALFYKYYS
ncbi:response regulator [Aquimarina pacifica]|uniref:response regulator n=1 Tax=Aquimarina pacifica TaxID=1296415 RepID=UPI00046EF6DD|nr:response regulator [Aquimarina pacifica]